MKIAKEDKDRMRPRLVRGTEKTSYLTPHKLAKKHGANMFCKTRDDVRALNVLKEGPDHPNYDKYTDYLCGWDIELLPGLVFYTLLVGYTLYAICPYLVDRYAKEHNINPDDVYEQLFFHH